MPTKRFTSEDLIYKLRAAEVISAQGKAVAEISRQLGVTEQTYLRWRKGYGVLKIDQAKRLTELEQENARLRRALSDAVIDNQMLPEVIAGARVALCNLTSKTRMSSMKPGSHMRWVRM